MYHGNNFPESPIINSTSIAIARSMVGYWSRSFLGVYRPRKKNLANIQPFLPDLYMLRRIMKEEVDSILYLAKCAICYDTPFKTSCT